MAAFITVVNLLVNSWLLIVLQRQRVEQRLPWFVYYIRWVVFASFAQLAAWPISPQAFAHVYWSIELVEIVLIVAAVRESFLRIFRGFTKLPWFRWTVSSVIAAVVAYSGWKAIYQPPVQSNLLVAFVIGSEYLFRWGIFGIAMLTTVLSAAVHEPMDTREDAIVTGFGAASLGFLINLLSRWFFGTKYLFLTKYAPTVGYFVAAFWWIWIFSHRVKGIGFEELGIGPEDMLKLMRRYRESVKRIRGKQ